MDTYHVIDKQTGEKLIGYHANGGIYQFGRDGDPVPIYTTMSDMVRILDQIAGCTGRKLTVVLV